MEIPQGAKFMFIAIPVVAVVSILIFQYVGKDREIDAFTDDEMEKISNGKEVEALNDYEKFEYEISKEGNGPSAVVGDTVVVNYEGTLIDGTKFDSSYDRNKPFEFKLGENMVIQGWEEGVKGMKVGEVRLLKIPSEMGYGSYGAGGVIPPYAGLNFKVELLEIK